MSNLRNAKAEKIELVHAYCPVTCVTIVFDRVLDCFPEERSSNGEKMLSEAPLAYGNEKSLRLSGTRRPASMDEENINCL